MFCRSLNRSGAAVAASVALAVVLAGMSGMTSMGAAHAAEVPTVDMGTAATYALLAGSALTNGGSAAVPTRLSGTAGIDIGLYPGGPTAFTAAANSFSDVGALNLTNSAAERAQTDAQLAYDSILPLAPTIILGELGGKTIGPGVYAPGAVDGSGSLVRTSAAFTTNGNLVLDGGGDPNAIFIFSTEAALSTAEGAQVTLTNEAQACNVYWRVGAAFSTGANATFVGHILAKAGATTGAGATIYGQLIALSNPDGDPSVTTGAASQIVNSGCAGSPSTVWLDSALGPVTVGVGYNDSLNVASSTAPTVASPDVVYGLAGGTALPAGLTLNWTTGVISGTPTAAGQFSFKIQATAVGSNPVSKVFTMGVRINMGATAPYAVLAETAFTNVGTSTLNGTRGNYLGVTTAGTAALVTGILLPDPIPTTQADVPTAAAQADALSAFNAGKAIPGAIALGAVLTAATLTPGTYQAPSAVDMAAYSTLTLDGEGDPNAVFVIRIPGALVIAGNTAVVLAGGTQASNVFWIIDGAFGVGATSVFSGTVIAGGITGAIVIGAGTTVHGQLISTTGAVTLSGNTITNDADLSTVWIDSTLMGGTVDTAYTDSLTVGVSENPTTVSSAAEFTVTTGVLPAGLALGRTTGELSGTPTTAGTASFTVSAVISGHLPVTKYFTLTVAPLPVAEWIDSVLANGTVGAAYSDSVSVGDSTSPTEPSTSVVFTVSTGSLPNGLSLSGGTISGTPTIVGTSVFTLRGVIPGHVPLLKEFTIVVAAAPVTATVWADSTLALVGTVGVFYSDGVSVTSTPATFTILAGSLPTGLLLDGTTGELSGSPTTAGSFTFIIEATASGHSSINAEFAIVVAAAPVTATVWIDGTLVTSAQVGSTYSDTLTAGVADTPAIVHSGVVFSVLSGAIPTGMSLSGGTLSGSPTTVESFTFTIEATAPGHSSINAEFTIVVVADRVVSEPEANEPETLGVPPTEPVSMQPVPSVVINPIVSVPSVATCRVIWKMSLLGKWKVVHGFLPASRHIPVLALFTVVRSPIAGQSKNVKVAVTKATRLAAASGGSVGGVLRGHLWRGSARIIVNW